MLGYCLGKSVKKIQVSLKSDKKSGFFKCDDCTVRFGSHLTRFFLKREMLQSSTENQHIHFIFNIFFYFLFFSKIAPFEIMWKKYSRVG